MVLKLLLSGGLLAFVLRDAGISDIGRLFERSFDRWPALAVAALLPAVSLVVAGVRWRMLLAPHGSRPSLGLLVRAQLVGTFYNMLMPSTVGGDLARGWWISRDVRSTAVSLAVVGVDRVLSIVGAAVLALGALWLLPQSAGGASRTVQTVSVALVGLAAAVVIRGLFRSEARAGKWSAPKLLPRARDVLGRLRAAFLVNRAQPRQLAGACALSVAVHLIIVLQYVILAKSLGSNAPAWHLAAIIPLVTVVTMIPVTINGIGLRETALAALGAPIGLAAADAVAVAWYVVTISFGYGIIGGLIHVGGPTNRAPESPKSSR
jgi:uncharacterized protein (TIRG00374 family)